MNEKKKKNTFTVSFEKPKLVYFASSIMENIVVFPAWSRFPVKLICYISLGLASTVGILLFT